MARQDVGSRSVTWSPKHGFPLPATRTPLGRVNGSSGYVVGPLLLPKKRAPRGMCPVCGRDVALSPAINYAKTTDATDPVALVARAHYGLGWDRCEGTGNLPGATR